MKRWVALAVVAAMLAVPAASATGWLQPRGDAAATGFQPEQGPEWPDVALRAELPGNIVPEADAPPLIVEDEVLFLARPYESPEDDFRVFSVDVHTGNVSAIAEGIDVASRLSLATDGETVYVSSARAVHAFPLGPSGNEWTWTWEPRTDAKPSETGCPQMALGHGSVTVLCSEQDEAETDDATGFERTQADAGAGDVTFVARLDAATGELDWGWDRPDPGTQQDGEPATRTFPIGMAVSASHVVIHLLEINGANGGGGSADADAGGGALAGQVRLTVWALSTEEGQPAWEQPWTSPERNATELYTPIGDPAGVSQFPRLIVGNPAASDNRVYIKADGVVALNLGTGEELWTQPVGKEDTEPGLGGGTAVSLAEGQLYLTTAQTVYRLAAQDPKDSWSTNLNLSAEQGFDEDPIVTPTAIYTVIEGEDGPETVLAFDPEDGSVRWRVPAREVSSFSAGNGLLAYTETEDTEEGLKATLVLLGQTEASPRASVDVGSTYPLPGEEVHVDLSDSEDGLQGPVSRYKAVWGDGFETDWQADPVLTHTYEEKGDTEARFVVANDANQTNSTTVTFHVGQEAPTEPNAIETAFQKENQEMTFGILGIAMALGGGVIGIARRRRKKSVLRQELDALERGYEDTKDQPSECEALLDNRKARARSLALDGKLEEQQVSVIENRAEELRRELRTGAVEAEFGFLPHALVVKARKMLEDGEVTELEAEAFLSALEDTEFLRDEQRALVRERIERWHGRDAGGSG